LLDPALASVLVHGSAERRWFDPSLEFPDSLSLPYRIPMHRILKPLHEMLEVRDPSFQHSEQTRLGLYCAGLCRFAVRLRIAAHVPDPSNQPLALTQGSPPTSRLVSRRAPRVSPALFIGHLANHQRAALHLLAHKLALLSPFLLDPLTRTLHGITSPVWLRMYLLLAVA
jgi:hypothetical protein